MTIFHSLKLTALLGLAMGLTVGCASTTDEATQETAPEVITETPAAEPEAPAAVPDHGSMMMSSNYEVVKGDNLWNISAKDSVYGNPYQWPLIYKNNSAQIKDADLIYPGQVLAVDTNPSSDAVSAAVTHAKTRGSWSLGVSEASDQAYLAQ
ncbi:MAG: LysM peptidoglycan-binding domain-containing protein [Gammaproteobacteria bacterium]|nr:LysM peptidoglycan-binding domain-containing protein [Gammaproteobacteria bacterium]